MNPPRVADRARRSLRPPPEALGPGIGRSRHPNRSPDLRELLPPAPTTPPLGPGRGAATREPLLVVLGPRRPAGAERWARALGEALAAARIGTLALALPPRGRRPQGTDALLDALGLAEGTGRLALLATGSWCGTALRAAAEETRIAAVVLVNPVVEPPWLRAQDLGAAVLVIQDAEPSARGTATDLLNELPDSACLTLHRRRTPAARVDGVARWLIARLGVARERSGPVAH